MIPDNLYNYISRHSSKPYKFLFCVALVILIGILLSQTKSEMYSDQNLYFYTFSTIVQGFLALVAFLGTVVIYKLQIIEQELNNIRDRMVVDLIDFRGPAANSYSWIEAKNEAESIIRSKIEQPKFFQNEALVVD